MAKHGDKRFLEDTETAVLKDQTVRSLSKKQVRARARRNPDRPLDKKEVEALMGKPIDEWDLEELAAGRPKDKNGRFSGPPPKWVTREIHEQAIERFKGMVRTDMRSLTVKALDVLGNILTDDEVDEKGRPLVSAGEKRQTAQFLIEHLIGKPTQPIETDISIKLQGILGAVLVQPSEMEAGRYVPSSSHRVVEGSVVDDEEDDDGE